MRKVDPDEYGSFKEEGKPIKFMSNLSEGRKSVFTARVGAGRKVKGYRATLLAQNNGITFYCYCSEKEFEKFRPAFDKVLESVTNGNRRALAPQETPSCSPRNPSAGVSL